MGVVSVFSDVIIGHLATVRLGGQDVGLWSVLIPQTGHSCGSITERCNQRARGVSYLL